MLITAWVLSLFLTVGTEVPHLSDAQRLEGVMKLLYFPTAAQCQEAAQVLHQQIPLRDSVGHTGVLVTNCLFWQMPSEGMPRAVRDDPRFERIEYERCTAYQCG